MSQWTNSTRRERLPDNWISLRKKVGKRDGWCCQHVLSSGEKCLEPANQVDHIIAGDDHSLSNLQCLCSYHHSKKSSSEGGVARAERRSRIRSSFRRGDDGHPGLL